MPPKLTPLHRCDLCRHYFPKEYISFWPSDIDWCRDREACKQRVLEQLESNLRAVNGDQAYWRSQHENLKFFGIGNLDVDRLAGIVPPVDPDCYEIDPPQ